MRKNKISVMLACLMAMILLSLSATPVFAKELSKEDLYATETKVISEESARGYANKMIEEMKEGELYIWNDTTEIDESVPMYDFEGNINSYLFRLKTDGVKQGYIVVDAKKDTAGVEICNDTEEYAVDAISKKKIGRPINEDDSIIRSGIFSFIIEEGNDKYKNFTTNEILSKSKEELIIDYNKTVDRQIKNLELQSNLNIKNSAPTSHTLPGVSTWGPYTTVFNPSDVNNCGPIAAMNLIYYWSHLHTNKKPALWNGDTSVYRDLKTYLKYNSKGILAGNVISGLTNYGKSRNMLVKGDNFKWDSSISWDFMKTNIANGNPLFVALYSDTEYGDHAVAAFGYQSLSSGTYLVVADGHSPSAKTLIKYTYTGSIGFVGYTRW